MKHEEMKKLIRLKQEITTIVVINMKHYNKTFFLLPNQHRRPEYMIIMYELTCDAL